MNLMLFCNPAKIKELQQQSRNSAQLQRKLPDLLVPCRGSTSLTYIPRGSASPFKVDNVTDRQDNGVRYKRVYFCMNFYLNNDSAQVVMCLLHHCLCPWRRFRENIF